MVRALRRVGNKAHHIEISDAETINVGGLGRLVSGAAALYSENFTTGIVIGGGTALTGASAIDISGVGNTAAGVRIRAGATADLTLGARGTTIALNDAVELSLDGSFSATSLIGALNELKSSGGGSPTVAKLDIASNMANYVMTLPAAAEGPFWWVINGVMYSNLGGHFGVTTVTNTNDTWTWNDLIPIGQLQTSDLSYYWHY